MRYHRRGFLALAALAAALTGCGGGGEITPPTVNPLSTTLRAYQAGDAWNYALHVTRQDYSADGTVSMSMARCYLVPDDTVPGLALTATYRYDGQVSDSTTIYIQSAATRDLRTVMSRNGLFLQSAEVTVPGVWSRDVAFSRTLADTQNDAEEMTLAVIGTERVTVPAGTFETWKTAISENNSLYESSGTYWYAPQTGQYVKAVYLITLKSGLNNGRTYTYEMRLTNTNVLPGG